MALFGKKTRKRAKPSGGSKKLEISLSDELKRYKIEMPESMRQAIWASCKSNYSVRFPIANQITLDEGMIIKAINDYEANRGYIPEEWAKFMGELKNKKTEFID